VKYTYTKFVLFLFLKFRGSSYNLLQVQIHALASTDFLTRFLIEQVTVRTNSQNVFCSTQNPKTKSLSYSRVRLQDTSGQVNYVKRRWNSKWFEMLKSYTVEEIYEVCQYTSVNYLSLYSEAVTIWAGTLTNLTSIP
jgi:hypothetical protein